MSATKERRTLSDADKLDRRERSVLRRVDAYEATMPYPRRAFYIECLEDAIKTLARVAPDGRRPQHLWPWEADEESREAAGEAIRSYDKARKDIPMYRMLLEAENAWAEQREAGDAR